MCNNGGEMEMQARKTIENCDTIISEYIKTTIDKSDVDTICEMDPDRIDLMQRTMAAYRSMTDLIISQSKALDQLIGKMEEIKELYKQELLMENMINYHNNRILELRQQDFR